MTQSNLDRTERAIKIATRQVYENPDLWLQETRPTESDKIIEAIEEHMGWDFNRRERDLALYTWKECRGLRSVS